MGFGEETIKFHTDIDSADVIFYCTNYCPYGQRAWITLQYKKINYKWIGCTLYSDDSPGSKVALTLYEKEKRAPGFTRVSPRGLVPGLRHGDVNVYESLPVIEYIDEAFPNDPLMPSSPDERAHIRIGITLWNELVVKRFYTFIMSPPEDLNTEESALTRGLEEMQSMFSADTHFFSPHGFSLFECSALPWFQRCLVVLSHYRNFTMDATKFERLHKWYGLCLLQECFRSTIIDEEILIRSYVGYATRSANNNCSELYMQRGEKKARLDSNTEKI